MHSCIGWVNDKNMYREKMACTVHYTIYLYYLSDADYVNNAINWIYSQSQHNCLLIILYRREIFTKTDFHVR